MKEAFENGSGAGSSIFLLCLFALLLILPYIEEEIIIETVDKFFYMFSLFLCLFVGIYSFLKCVLREKSQSKNVFEDLKKLRKKLFKRGILYVPLTWSFALMSIFFLFFGFFALYVVVSPFISFVVEIVFATTLISLFLFIAFLIKLFLEVLEYRLRLCVFKGHQIYVGHEAETADILTSITIIIILYMLYLLIYIFYAFSGTLNTLFFPFFLALLVGLP